MRRQIVTLGALLLSLLVGCSSPQQPAPPEPAPAPTPAPEPSPAIFTPKVSRRDGAPEAEAQIGTFAFADPQHGWIAIDDQILATADSGTTWTDLGHVGAKVVALDLVTPTTGWVGTEKGIYVPAKVSSGWEQIDTGIVADLDFIDATHGWALMNYRLWQTTDGGRHWAPMPSSCGSAMTARLSFTNAASGWLLCGGQGGTGKQGKSLLHSTDGGESWQVVASACGPCEPSRSSNLPSGGYVSDLYFLDDQHGWISLARGSVLATKDGGQTWTATGGIEVEAVTPFTLRFLTPSDGLLLLRGGGIHTTGDGGRTWSPLYPSLGPRSRLPLQMLSPTHWVSGERMNDAGAILWTTNQGQTWQQVASLGSDLRSLSFINPTFGWALDGEGRVHATTDGGVTWQALASSPPGGEERFFRLQFFTQERGYAISGWGHIYETTDGGKRFIPVDLENWTSETSFATPEIGWRTKDFTIYASTDGGKNWQPLGLETRVVDFALTSPQTGWVIGGAIKDGTHQPVLFGTQDGGKHWTQYDLPGIKAAALRFADPDHGLLLDQENRLFATADGGQSWTELP
ncbi:MAG TPA: YCF48-related protein [Symbiobacteriaceae bacterium]|nr:YCF48-related protein [Symbiobacteriaceae bacterium]